jgi:hypothetical protein
MVTAAYLMFRDGLTREQALTALRTHRPQVCPNPAFMRLLLKWEDSVQKSRKSAG